MVAATEDEAVAAIDAMMDRQVFGDAGAAVVIEECLTGDEVSLFALCDGEDALLLGSAQDHKRVGDGDTGPNTGGMGAYSPVPSFPPALEQACMEQIIRPALKQMVHRGTPFRGILFAGLMLTEEGAKLIEFNVRFGDPECQVLLRRMKSDLLPALQAACDGELRDFDLRWHDNGRRRGRHGGARLPGRARTRLGDPRPGQAAAPPGVSIFHAGTEAGPDGSDAGRGRPGADGLRHRPRLAAGARRRLRGDRQDRLARGLLPPRHRAGARYDRHRENRAATGSPSGCPAPGSPAGATPSGCWPRDRSS